MHTQVLGALLARAQAAGLPDPELRARATFGLIGELSSQTVYELHDQQERARMQSLLLAMAVEEFESRRTR